MGTLAEYIYRLVLDGETKSWEFQTLVNYYGKEKLRRLYKEEKEKRAGETVMEPKTVYQKIIHDT